MFDLSPPFLQTIAALGLNALASMFILLGGWLAANWVSRFVEVRSEKTGKVDRTLSIVIGKITRATILILTLIAVLNRFGVQTASLVALLGAAGLAIGLALQGALSNVAAGVMLLVFRPFKVGDHIDFGTVGIVDEIGLFLTRMHTPDNIAMWVPNAKIWGSTIMNYAENPTRRMDMVYAISYTDDMDKAVSLLKELVAAEPRFLKDPAPLVAVGELADSSVNIYVRPWVKRTDFLDAKLDFTKRVKQRFDALGITIPFPQRTVHVVPETKLAGRAA